MKLFVIAYFFSQSLSILRSLSLSIFLRSLCTCIRHSACFFFNSNLLAYIWTSLSIALFLFHTFLYFLSLSLVIIVPFSFWLSLSIYLSHSLYLFLLKMYIFLSIFISFSLSLCFFLSLYLSLPLFLCLSVSFSLSLGLASSPCLFVDMFVCGLQPIVTVVWKSHSQSMQRESCCAP